MTQANALTCIRVRNKRIFFCFFARQGGQRMGGGIDHAVYTTALRLLCRRLEDPRDAEERQDVDSMWIRWMEEGQEEGQQKLEWSLPCRPTASSVPNSRFSPLLANQRARTFLRRAVGLRTVVTNRVMSHSGHFCLLCLPEHLAPARRQQGRKEPLPFVEIRVILSTIVKRTR